MDYKPYQLAKANRRIHISISIGCTASFFCAGKAFIKPLGKGKRMPKTFLKLPQVSTITGRSRSKIYADIKAHTFPAPVRLGARSVAWVDHEINTWIQAKIAGQTDEELKALVASLEAARQTSVSI